MPALPSAPRVPAAPVAAPVAAPALPNATLLCKSFKPIGVVYLPNQHHPQYNGTHADGAVRWRLTYLLSGSYFIEQYPVDN